MLKPLYTALFYSILYFILFHYAPLQVDFCKAVEAVLPTLKFRTGPAFDNEAKVLPGDFFGIELPKPIDAGDVVISAGVESGSEETEEEDSRSSRREPGAAI
jgi:hypothetical protein